MSKGGGLAAPPEGWTEIKSWRKEDSVETEDGLCGSIDIPTPLRSTDINRVRHLRHRGLAHSTLAR
eukprot:m.140638 g.140638  ORF g.140638 m.140638 type:complete len:66 (-) comp22812_c0_seq3:1421-1618(-)